jgi:hypothetical protein
MLLTSGDIIGMVKDALKWTDDDGTRLYGPLSMAYWDICELTDWPLLRKVKAASFAGSALAMPSDTVGVINVIGAGNDPFWQVDEADIYTSATGRKRWHYAGKAEGSSLAAYPSIQIIDANGAALSESVSVYYWVYQARITSITDPILVPTSRALVIKTVQYVMSTIDHDHEAADRLAQEYTAAVAELLAKTNKPNRYGGGRR